MKEIFGISAIVIGIVGGLPYIIGILRGQTKPHRISWAIWAFISLVSLTSYISSGAKWSSLLIVAAAFNNMVIFILSIKYGVGGSGRLDRLALALGALGVLLWLVTSRAGYGLLFAIAADSIGTTLTARKAYKQPYTENLTTWSMAVAASLFGLLAINNYTFYQTIYPVYAITGGLTLAGVTYFRRRLIEQP